MASTSNSTSSVAEGGPEGGRNCEHTMRVAAAAAISHNTMPPGVHLLFARTVSSC